MRIGGRISYSTIASFFPGQVEICQAQPAERRTIDIADAPFVQYQRLRFSLKVDVTFKKNDPGPVLNLPLSLYCWLVRPMLFQALGSADQTHADISLVQVALFCHRHRPGFVPLHARVTTLAQLKEIAGSQGLRVSVSSIDKLM